MCKKVGGKLFKKIIRDFVKMLGKCTLVDETEYFLLAEEDSKEKKSKKK